MSVFAGNVPTPKGLHNEENVISQDRPKRVKEAKESEKRRVQGFEDSRGQVEKVRSQKTEVRKQKSEVRGQRVRGLAKNKTNQRK